MFNKVAARSQQSVYFLRKDLAMELSDRDELINDFLERRNVQNNQDCLEEFKSRNQQRLSDKDEKLINDFIGIRDKLECLGNDFTTISSSISKNISDYLSCMSKLSLLLETAMIAKNIGTFETFLVSRKEYINKSGELNDLDNDISRLKIELIKSLDNLSSSHNCILDEFIKTDIFSHR
jgi:hypothetical protein